MKSNFFTIIKKELYRFFKDPKMIFTTVFLPGIIIFIAYSLLADGMNASQEVNKNYHPSAYIENLPESLESIVKTENLNIENFDNLDDAKKRITQKNLDIAIVFPSDFDNKIKNIKNSINLNNSIKIELYYNSSKKESLYVYNNIISFFNSYENSIVKIFDINTNTSDISTDVDRTSSMISSILPMMIIMFLFTGCMNLAPESIAGEKERGTIATLLATPVNRTEIILGKIISLVFFAVLNGISSFIGIMLAIPKMMNSNNNINIYKINHYIYILLVVISTVLLIISLISLISTLSKSVREASALSSPLMIISMLISITPMFNVEFSDFYWRLIPIFNSVLCLNDVFSFNINSINIVLTILSNTVYSVFIIMIISKMFKNEKIIFNA